MEMRIRGGIMTDAYDVIEYTGEPDPYAIIAEDLPEREARREAARAMGRQSLRGLRPYPIAGDATMYPYPGYAGDDDPPGVIIVRSDTVVWSGGRLILEVPE